MRLTHKKEDWYWKDEEFWLSAENPSLEKADELYYKLAEFEDFMEEQGFEDLDAFRMAIKLNQLMNKAGVEHFKENQALKARWEKLKEYTKQEAEVDYQCCHFGQDILEKMKKLEEE